jgi:hypothetical protein
MEGMEYWLTAAEERCLEGQCVNEQDGKEKRKQGSVKDEVEDEVEDKVEVKDHTPAPSGVSSSSSSSIYRVAPDDSY